MTEPPGSGCDVGANGRTGQQWKRMLPDLSSRLGRQCNVRTACLNQILSYYMCFSNWIYLRQLALH